MMLQQPGPCPPPVRPLAPRLHLAVPYPKALVVKEENAPNLLLMVSLPIYGPSGGIGIRSTPPLTTNNCSFFVGSID